MSKTIYTTSLLILSLFLLSSCGEDRRKESNKLTEVQTKIYDHMMKYYLWYEDIPSKDDLNFFQKPESFFLSLLSEKDGYERDGKHYYFSYLENNATQTRGIANHKDSYGFEFQAINFTNTNEHIIIVLYVIKDSPADKAGIKRGDVFNKINNKPLSQDDFTNLLAGPSIKLTKTYKHYPNSSNKEEEFLLGASTSIEANPVFLSKTLVGNKVGYLMYNEFVKGKGGDDDTYDRFLINEVQKLKNKGVEDLILDLRYNNGGLISSAILLSSLLCPEHILGQKIGYSKFNDKNQNLNEDYKALDDAPIRKANLNLNRICVLTSQRTASASELIINYLRQYMDVHVIGETTVGKNVGSGGFEFNNIKMRPIILQIYSADGWSDQYKEGFKPGVCKPGGMYPITDYEISEIPSENFKVNLLELGNELDPLLQQGLNAFGYNQLHSKTKATTRSSSSQIKQSFNSINARQKGGLITSIHP